MIPESQVRNLAAWLLHWAIRIAPRETLDWAQAMLGELHHVEGDWAALAWALGGAGVLAKHAFLSLIIPGRGRQVMPSPGDLLGQEGSMRRIPTLLPGVSVAVLLLFFLAPTFRQGMQSSLRSWQALLDGGAAGRARRTLFRDER